jgi:hypothetical protein
MLSVSMLSAFMLSVVAPHKLPQTHAWCNRWSLNEGLTFPRRHLIGLSGFFRRFPTIFVDSWHRSEREVYTYASSLAPFFDVFFFVFSMFFFG